MTFSSTIGTPGQLRATKALLKFCRDHRHAAFFIERLEACLVALQAKDKDVVLDVLQQFRRAGMGSYMDWYPDVICEHEDAEYVETVWWALTLNWNQSLSKIG